MGVETLNRAKRVCIRESVPLRSDGNKPLGFFSNYALARKWNKTICNSCKNERERECVSFDLNTNFYDWDDLCLFIFERNSILEYYKNMY